MKKIAILAMALSLAIPSILNAKTERDDGTDFGGRISAEVDKKLVKGLHTYAGGEARFDDDFSNFGRYQGTLGVSYKINKILKTNLSYTIIQKKNSSDEWKSRNRLTFDITVSERFGDFKLSLRERFQVTHRNGSTNRYQDNKNACVLRSRLMLQYKGLTAWTPYAYAEIRNTLNAPEWSATYDESTGIYSDIDFKGNKDVYINRVRGALGASWELSKRHSFDFFALYDYCYDKDIDTNKKGTKLRSLEYVKSYNISLGVGYKFSF